MAGRRDRRKPPEGRPLLSDAEMRRYGRHLIMPEVTLEGQQALKASSALVVGAGGLGAPIALYLAAAGVGRLGLVDFDIVDLSNLQRQVVFGTSDVGRPKVAAAARRLRDLNPEIEIVEHHVRLAADNALEIVGGYHVVLDGSDNFATRYLVSDACVACGKPDVFGSVFRFAGQASVFATEKAPCYRCLYPEPPAPGAVPSCAEAGVLGVLPGIIGSIQAIEAIKLILGVGETLEGRLLVFDGLGSAFHELAVRRDPGCPACGRRSAGERETLVKSTDYEAFCGAPARPGIGALLVEEITAPQLKSRLDAGEDVCLLDVREPAEYRIGHLDALLIPLSELPGRVGELDPARDTVVVCRWGARSAAATAFLRRSGFERVWNLRGGLEAWAEEVDPDFPKC